MKITKKELKERAKSSKEVAQLVWDNPDLLAFYGHRGFSDQEEIELTPEQEKCLGANDQADQEIQDWAKAKTEEENRFKNQKQ